MRISLRMCDFSSVFDVLFSSLCLVNEQGGGALGVIAMHCGNSSSVLGEEGCIVSI